VKINSKLSIADAFKWRMNGDSWMHIVKSPTPYRVGNRRLSLRLNLKFMMLTFSFVFSMFVLFSLINRNNRNDEKASNNFNSNNNQAYQVYDDGKHNLYNSIYPLTQPFVDQVEKSKTYRLLIVADLDTNSKQGAESKYASFLLKGSLKIFDDLKRAEIMFDTEPNQLISQYAYGDRGMELSELVVFNGRLYSCDDRTGIVYEILPEKRMAIPWILLVDGDGRNTSKGFKCEWMTVKDQKLYVGGLGKEWTTAKGAYVNDYPQWIKIVGHIGDVRHVNWAKNYNKIREKGGFMYPGYMIFESCSWNNREKKWYFLPRRASKELYDETLDEKRATNLMIVADEKFEEISMQPIGIVVPLRGYSSFKFVPNTDERIIIAIKSEEDEGKTRTYVTLFDTNGYILVQDQLISDKLKYEGIEFV
jgi:soluble calcium-activated nucleotidase 1